MKEKLTYYDQVARNSVLTAMRVSSAIQNDLSELSTLIKGDKSPVTLADFAVQAVICHELQKNCPEIPIVAEENSGLLRCPEHRSMVEIILSYLRTVDLELTADSLLQLIDRGDGAPGDLYWTLDPIDGTKGFLRRDQYAIALALIKSGEVLLGVLGCPRLAAGVDMEPGCLLRAVKDEGAFLSLPEPESRLTLPFSEPDSPMLLTQSFVSTHGDQEKQKLAASRLPLAAPPLLVDSQVKYAMIALNQAQVYLRIPGPGLPIHREKIWDHAAGSLIASEAGALVSDLEGLKLDYSHGLNLEANLGIMVSPPNRQAEVLRAISPVRAE